MTEITEQHHHLDRLRPIKEFVASQLGRIAYIGLDTLPFGPPITVTKETE